MNKSNKEALNLERLRDEFAISVSEWCIESMISDVMKSSELKKKYPTYEALLKGACENAYEIADAMMEARKK